MKSNQASIIPSQRKVEREDELSIRIKDINTKRKKITNQRGGVEIEKEKGKPPSISTTLSKNTNPIRKGYKSGGTQNSLFFGRNRGIILLNSR